MGEKLRTSLLYNTSSTAMYTDWAACMAHLDRLVKSYSRRTAYSYERDGYDSSLYFLSHHLHIPYVPLSGQCKGSYQLDEERWLLLLHTADSKPLDGTPPANKESRPTRRNLALYDLHLLILLTDFYLPFFEEDE